MATSGCDLMSQIERDLRLPPRKRLLAVFKNQNSYRSPSSPLHCLSSSSSSSSSSDSSSASDPSPESEAELAVKAAKAAREIADDKAMIASKAVEVAKNALAMLASRKERKNKHGELTRRLNRSIDNSSLVLFKDCTSKIRKSVVAGVADSDMSNGQETDRTVLNGKVGFCNDAMKEESSVAAG
ncbi:unnamed protein product [Cochlearia groenlandica]